METIRYAVLAVGATVAGVAFGWPGHSAAPMSVTVAPAPADTELQSAGITKAKPATRLRRQAFRHGVLPSLWPSRAR